MQEKTTNQEVAGMAKWSDKPTAKARQMLIDGVARSEIADSTGLTLQSIRSIASTMRKSGVELPMAQKRYEYTGINRHGQVVKFRSLTEGVAQGFKGEYVSFCVNGNRDRYVGYTWSRREIS